MTALKKTVIATVAAAAFALASLPAKAADIVDTAVSAGSFKTLVTAVQAAGLVETLKGEGPFTVFAPTDDAFAKLPAGTVDDLLKPENKEKLVAILTYHVVPGKVMSTDIAGKEMEVASVQGDTIDVNATSGVMVDGATVTQAAIAQYLADFAGRSAGSGLLDPVTDLAGTAGTEYATENFSDIHSCLLAGGIAVLPRYV